MRRRSDTYNIEQWDRSVLQHRIEYFSWRGIKVWDKPARVDRVFGSSGVAPGTPLLSDMVAAAPVRVARHGDAAAASATSGETGRQPSGGTPSGASSGPSSRRFGAGDSRAGKGQGEPRPTHFFCIRVSGTGSLGKRVTKVQRAAVAGDDRLADAVLPASRLHVTLATVRLPDDAAVASAAAVLLRMSARFTQLFPAPASRLSFTGGLTCFRDRVLVAQPDPNPALMQLQRELVANLREAGTCCTRACRDTCRPPVYARATRASCKRGSC